MSKISVFSLCFLGVGLGGGVGNDNIKLLQKRFIGVWHILRSEEGFTNHVFGRGFCLAHKVQSANRTRTTKCPEEKSSEGKVSMCNL